MYSPPGNADIIALTVALLSKVKERIVLTDSHRQKQGEIPSGSIELEESIILALTWFTSLDK